MTDLQDDLSISDEENLIRRIPPWPNMMIKDGQTGNLRPTSACFSDRETKGKELSITLETDLLASGKNLRDALNGELDFGLATITVDLVRNRVSVSQLVVKDPLPSDEFHGLVIGDKPTAVKRKLAKEAAVAILPGAFIDE